MIPERRDFRDRRHHALATLSELAAPLLRSAARAMVRAAPTAPLAWRRGIILGHAHIGDVLYRTASLDALARGLPDCRWFYLSTPFAAEVLRGNPAIEEVLPWMDRAEPESALRQHSSALRDFRFDVALCTENVRTHAALTMAVGLGIPNRVAFTHKGFSGLATHGVRLRAPAPRAVQIQAMVSAITGVDLSDEPRPRVFPSDEDTTAAAAEWERITTRGSSCVIACSVTQRQAVGIYPPELFAATLRAVLKRDPRARILFIGAESDAALLAQLARDLGPRAIVSAGRLGVRAAVALLARCDAFLGSDSGPRHLANAAGIPVFFIRNLGASQIGTGAYLSNEHDLAPAGQFLTPAQARETLRAIDPDAVAAQILAAAMRARGRPADTPR